MKTNKKIIQLGLISIGFFLILVTYFLYPQFIENKFYTEKTIVQKEVETEGNKLNIFENVEYKGLYDVDIPFTVKSKNAYILAENPELIYMTDMHVILDMDDGRIVTITSDKGSYNKVTYDCFFQNNVRAVDGKTTVLANNLDLLATENTAAVYNNVFLTNDKSTLKADKVNYDFEAKYYQVSMYNNDEKVKIKLTK